MMDDFEFAKRFQGGLEKYLQETSDEDFTLNPPQALAFSTLVCRLKALAQKTDGTVEPIHLVPRLGYGDVTAYLPLLALQGEEVHKLCCALRCATAVTVDALIDGNICISITVPDVFIEKSFSYENQ